MPCGVLLCLQSPDNGRAGLPGRVADAAEAGSKDDVPVVCFVCAAAGLAARPAHTGQDTG